MNATHREYGAAVARGRAVRASSLGRRAVGIITVTALAATSLATVAVTSASAAVNAGASVASTAPTPRNTPATLMAGTFNVNHGRTGLGASAKRLNGIAGEIRRGGFDVLGVQESATEMRNSLIPRLAPTYTYSMLGHPKGINSTGGQIFYRPDVLTPGSIAGIIALPSPSSGNPRSGLYQDFYHRATGTHFLFASVHLSNLAGRAASDVRNAQASRLMSELSSVNHAGLPLVLAGDMNSNAASKYVYDAPRQVYHGYGLSEVFDRAAAKVNAKYNSFNHLQVT
ncbi:MAG: endonuclease/exonuclease/phosphatase family protein, partial [Candidatus Nanopelagicales bacterium]